MNPMELLVASKNLTGGGRKNPYDFKGVKSLPKFAPVGRPISLAPPVKPPEAPSSELFRMGALNHVPVGAQAKPAMAISQPVAVTAASVKLAKGPVSWAGRRARGAREMVQGELSLDKVKVMRNDLNDSDWEIVAAKPASPSVGTADSPDSSAAFFSWAEWVSRAFGAVRSRI